MMPSKVLVAGSTGYLGRHVVRALHASGYPVRALVRSEARLGDVRPLCSEVFVGEATRPETLRGVIRDARVVFSSLGKHDFKRKPTTWEVDRDANLNLVRAAKEAGVITEVRLDAEIDRVLINKVQIQQVIVNLKRNAIEAMEGCEKRELTISTRLVAADKIRVDIADTGSGLPEAIKNRLFEPFTTTKRHGSGVGLSISRLIIEAHNGKLWAEEQPEGGTVFSFVLPVMRA